jgi:hypothetical protein
MHANSITNQLHVYQPDANDKKHDADDKKHDADDKNMARI